MFDCLSDFNSGTLDSEFSFFQVPLYHLRCLHNSRPRQISHFTFKTRPTKTCVDKKEEQKQEEEEEERHEDGEEGSRGRVPSGPRLLRMDQVYYPLIDFYRQDKHSKLSKNINQYEQRLIKHKNVLDRLWLFFTFRSSMGILTSIDG